MGRSVTSMQPHRCILDHWNASERGLDVKTPGMLLMPSPAAPSLRLTACSGAADFCVMQPAADLCVFGPTTATGPRPSCQFEIQSERLQASQIWTSQACSLINDIMLQAAADMNILALMPD